MDAPDDVKAKVQTLLERMLKAGGVAPDDAAAAAADAVEQEPVKGVPR